MCAYSLHRVNELFQSSNDTKKKQKNCANWLSSGFFSLVSLLKQIDGNNHRSFYACASTSFLFQFVIFYSYLFSSCYCLQFAMINFDLKCFNQSHECSAIKSMAGTVVVFIDCHFHFLSIKMVSSFHFMFFRAIRMRWKKVDQPVLTWAHGLRQDSNQPPDIILMIQRLLLTGKSKHRLDIAHVVSANLANKWIR